MAICVCVNIVVLFGIYEMARKRYFFSRKPNDFTRREMAEKIAKWIPISKLVAAMCFVNKGSVPNKQVKANIDRHYSVICIAKRIELQSTKTVKTGGKKQIK